MNLVNELQVSAEQDDVLTVLRKTKRLASKLGRQDIGEWLKAEQEGYSEGQTVPRFRMVATRLAYNTNGYIPAGFGFVKSGIEDLPIENLCFPIPMRDSINEVVTLIADLNQGNGLYRNIEGTAYGNSVRSHLRFNPHFENQISLMIHLDSGQVRAIPDQIKDHVLDWACKLEEAGVTGDNMSFSNEEKKIAHSIIFNINNSQIDQLNNMGSNRKG
jgi:hypothetical protein